MTLRRAIPVPILPLAALLLALAYPCGSAESTTQAKADDLLSDDGRAALRGFLDSASHPDLTWSDFHELRSEVECFYKSGGYALAWVRGSGPTEQARALIEILRDAGGKGLEPQDYDGPRWTGRLARLDQTTPPPSESERVRFDVAVTVSVMRYLSDLRDGRIDPRRVDFELDVQKRDGEALSDLLRQRIVRAEGTENLAAAIVALEPPFAAYRRTLRALETYLRLARRDEGESLPAPPAPKKVIRAGERYPGVPRLARLLRLVGDLPESAAARGDAIYEGALVDAVSRFQRRHGLVPDGGLDARTIEQLNRPLARRVSQLNLTLERWRWLPHRFVTPPIVVNIPEFRLHAGEMGHRWSMKVVVGRAYSHRTPVFASEMRSVIFRPYWNVPLGIQRGEILPRIASDPGYLTRGGFEITDRRGQAVVPGSPTGEVLEQLRSGALRIRQRPGPRNSLGQVKFALPNDHDVYLHGTPSPELFHRPRRDFSHGCIRVEDPVALVAWALRDRPEWTVERIRAAMSGSRTVQVSLLHPIPVLILYGTAVVAEDGEVRFFDDIYGLDAALERALAERRPDRSG